MLVALRAPSPRAPAKPCTRRAPAQCAMLQPPASAAPHPQPACLRRSVLTGSALCAVPGRHHRRVVRAAAVMCSCSAAGAAPDAPPLAARVALALSLGAAGALCAASLRLPLPWMLGSLSAAAVGALAGLPLALPPRLRLTWQTVVGVALGAAFEPSLWDRMLRFSSTLSLLLLATAAATSLGAAMLRRFAGYAPATAFFAAVPGGLNDMTIIGAELGGDERVIALSHTVRLVTVVSVLPFLMRSAYGAASSAPAAAAGSGLAAALGKLSWTPLAPRDALLLAACAVAGPALGRALRIPARFLVGPMLLSAAAHVCGATAARPPAALLAAAQVVVGAAVGCRFVGVRVSSLGRVALAAGAVATMQLGVAAAVAAAASAASGTPWALLMLAYSPGGITEMTLTAIALGFDAAFVATHHVARIVAITTLTPLAFALAARLRAAKDVREE